MLKFINTKTEKPKDLTEIKLRPSVVVNGKINKSGTRGVRLTGAIVNTSTERKQLEVSSNNSIVSVTIGKGLKMVQLALGLFR